MQHVKAEEGVEAAQDNRRKLKERTEGESIKRERERELQEEEKDRP